MYNLIDDPNEIINLAELRPDKVRELTEKMNLWLEKRKKETGMETPIHDQGDWHGHEGIGSFKTSEQAYNTLRLLDATTAKRISEKSR